MNSLIDVFSSIKVHKIHFHNGLLQTHSFENQKGPWQLQAWPNIHTDFPAYPWIQNLIATDKKDTHRNRSQGQPPPFQNTKPSMGYALFVDGNSQPSYEEIPKRHLHVPNQNDSQNRTDRIKHPPILHIHFSFDKDYKQAPFASLKNFIFLEKGANMVLIESFELSGKKENAVQTSTDVQSEAHSSLNWISVQQGEENSSLSLETYGNIKSHASINRLSLAQSTGYSKDYVTLHHIQEKARSLLLGLDLLKKKSNREQKWHTRVLEPRGYSRQYFKGILNDQAKSLFQGKVSIAPHATQADCAQSAKNLLLSHYAHSLLRPEMEVHCGEVKAQHGATTGQLNLDEMFYLQSRGLQKAEAIQMLIMSHIQDILSFFPEKHISRLLLKDIQKNKTKYLNLLTDTG